MAASGSRAPTARSGCSRCRAAEAARNDLPDELRGPLRAESDETNNLAVFPYGCHVCEVEVDPDTGVVEIVRYTAVDDVGRAVNPLIVHGQIHGGIAQGVGQALSEQCVYDRETGQLLSGSFMDYAMPRAELVPFFTTELSEVPTPTHPLGIRPAGEGGTTPALGVVINAIVDALAEFGVTHIEMPGTPERVWRAIQEAGASQRQAGRRASILLRRPSAAVVKIGGSATEVIMARIRHIALTTKEPGKVAEVLQIGLLASRNCAAARMARCSCRMGTSISPF